MRTNIVIDDDLMAEALRQTGAKTKREAVVGAVEDFNRRHRLAALAKRLHGSMPNFMTQADLKIMRENRKWEAAK